MSVEIIGDTIEEVNYHSLKHHDLQALWTREGLPTHLRKFISDAYSAAYG